MLPLIRVISAHQFDELDTLRRGMGQEFGDASSLLVREVEIHATRFAAT